MTRYFTALILVAMFIFNGTLLAAVSGPSSTATGSYTITWDPISEIPGRRELINYQVLEVFNGVNNTPYITGSPSITFNKSVNGSYVYTVKAWISNINPRTGDDIVSTSTLGTHTVSVNIPMNPPVAVNDSESVNEGANKTITVLTNDYDPDGDTITIISNTNPSLGSVNCNSSTCTYTAPSNLSANTSTSFNYTINDGKGGSDSATVTITLNNLLERVASPVISPSSGTYQESKTISISTSTSGATIKYRKNGGSYMTYYSPFTITSTTAVDTYATKPDWTNSGVTSGSITINHAPVAVNDSSSVNEGANKTISVLSNDSDPDGDAISISSHSNPSKGSVSCSSSNCTYTAPTNISANTTTSFTYTITDGLLPATATVSITIYNQSVDTVATPVISPSSGTYQESKTISISTSTSGATIKYRKNGGSYMTYYSPFTITSTTAVDTYATKPDWTNSSVNSGSIAINHPPVISGNPETSINIGGSYSFIPEASDPDNNTLTFSIQNKPSWASFNTASGSLTGTPSSGGTHSNIIISVNDGYVPVPLPAYSISVSAMPDYGKKTTVIVDDVQPVTPNVPAQQAVGALAGEVGISGGAVSYSIPIVVPPGRNGAQPNVSLSYSSRGGRGLVGNGWNLNASEAIHRCSATYELDKFAVGIQMNNQDRLCLNGERLKLVNNSNPEVSNTDYWASGAIYHPETNLHVLVTFVSGSYFEVEYTNGDTKYFGETSDEQIIRGNVLSWLISRKEDSSQNSIIYDYATLGDLLNKYLTKIHYTGTGITKGNRRVDFGYETRPDTRFSYTGGVKSTETRRLLSVKTVYNNTDVSDYQLIYRDSVDAVNPIDDRGSQLDSIEYCANDSQGNPACLPKTVFDYNDWDPNFAARTNDVDLTTVGNVYEALKYGDYDGDGFSDYVTDTSVFLSSVNDWRSVSDYVENDNGHSAAPQSMDFNLDGRVDLMGSFHESGVYFLAFSYWDNGQFNSVAATDEQGNDILTRCLKFDTGDTNIATSNCASHMLDVNKDGKTDLVIATGVNYNITWKLYLNCHDGSAANAGTPCFKSASAEYSVGGSSNATPHPFTQFDLDSDGDVEFVGSRKNGVYRSDAWVRLVISLEETTTADFYEFSDSSISATVGREELVADFNGDGKVDVVRLGLKSSGSSIRFGTGDGLTSSQPLDSYQVVNGSLVAESSFERGDKNAYVAAPGRVTIDYNQDGLMDFLVAGSVATNDTCPAAQEAGDVEDKYECIKEHRTYYWHLYQAEIDANQKLYFVHIDESVLNIEARLKDLNVIDTDGDGADDLVVRYGTHFSETPKPKAYYRYKNNNALADKLNSITVSHNGLNKLHQFEYQSLAQLMDQVPKRYTYGLEQTFPYVKYAPSAVMVSSYTTDDGIGGRSTSQWSYSDARYHLQGRGFQGFKTLTRENVSQGSKTTTTFEQGFPYTGSVTEVFSEAKDSYGNYQVVSKQTNTWDSVVKENAYKTYQSATESWKYELNNNTQLLHVLSSVDAIDDWGFVTESTKVTDTGSGDITVNNTAQFDHNSWLGKPLWTETSTQAITSRTGVVIVAGTDFTKTIRTNYDEWDTAKRLPEKVTTTPTSTSGGTAIELSTVYNSFGLPTSITTKELKTNTSRSVSTTYSKDGVTVSSDGYFVYQVTNDLGHVVTTQVYPEHGQLKTVMDANNITTSTYYNAFAQVDRVNSAGVPDVYSRYAWCDGCDGVNNSNIQYKVTTYSAGAPESVTYNDKLNRAVLVKTYGLDGRAIYVNTTYNALGQTTFTSIPSFDIDEITGTSYTSYDALNRLLTKNSLQANGTSLSVEYDYHGFQTIVTVNGRTMSRTHNGLGQLIQTIDVQNNTSEYAYDALGNPIVLKDANGHSITAKFNAKGEKEWVNDPNMGLKSFTYTGFGEVKTEVDANSDETEYVYDVLGRLKNRSINDVLEANFIFDSNCLGLPFSESRSDLPSGESFSRSYSYDGLCRVSSTQTYIDGNATPYTMSTQYDANYGRVKAITYPNSLTVAYEYNSTGFLTRTYNPSSDYTYSKTLTNDARGQWTDAEIINEQANVSRSYFDNTGQMKSTELTVGAITKQKLNYAYDNFGNLTNTDVTNNINGSPTLDTDTFTFDTLNRLKTSVRNNGNPDIYYDYDAVGNLTKKSDFSLDVSGSMLYGDSTKQYNYAGPNAVRSVSLKGGGSRTYSYDLNGNMVDDGIRTIEYNAFNKPVRIDVLAGYKINPDDTLSSTMGTTLFSYGADQMRYKKVHNDNGVNTTTLYIGKAYEEITKGSEVKKKVYIGDIAVLTETVNSGNSTFSIGFMHRDRLGSATAILDETALMVQTSSFDPFGKPRDGRLKDKPDAILDSLITDRGFTDHEHLDNSQLIHMNGRAYDYNLGRFMSVDPFIQDPGNSQAMNPYSYILNNPLAGTDPSGYCVKGIGNDKGCHDDSEDNVTVIVQEGDMIQQTPDGNFLIPGDKTQDIIKIESMTKSDSNGISFYSISNSADKGSSSGTNGVGGCKASPSSCRQNGNPNNVGDVDIGSIVREKYPLSTILDFTPVVGDAKGIAEAVEDPTLINVSAAGIGLIPGVGDGIAASMKGAKNLRNATEAGSELLPSVTKAVNSNMGHAVDRAVERGIFPDVQAATQGLKDLSSSIKRNGFPEGTIPDPAHADRVLIPFGNGGMAAYQVAKNGTAKLKTVLIAK